MERFQRDDSASIPNGEDGYRSGTEETIEKFLLLRQLACGRGHCSPGPACQGDLH